MKSDLLGILPEGGNAQQWRKYQFSGSLFFGPPRRAYLFDFE